VGVRGRWCGDLAVAAEADGGPFRLALEGEARVLADDAPAQREVCVRLLDVPAEVHEPFYGVISNPLLWFVQHRLHDLKSSPALGRDERAAFEDGYAVANELAADAVVEQVEAAGGRPSSCCTTTTSTSSGTWSGSAARAP
jgi:trehalose 6-phosphate synthase